MIVEKKDKSTTKGGRTIKLLTTKCGTMQVLK
jgi:hypothetical protein